MIYKPVELENESTVRDQMKNWLKDDLRISKIWVSGRCLSGVHNRKLSRQHEGIAGWS
jgi:hypothetical protein